MPDAPAPAATAARAILGGQVRHALTALATLAITHGVATQGQADAIVPPLVDYLTGAALLGVSTLWSARRAIFDHSRWARAWAALTGDDKPTA